MSKRAPHGWRPWKMKARYVKSHFWIEVPGTDYVVSGCGLGKRAKDLPADSPGYLRCRPCSRYAAKHYGEAA